MNELFARARAIKEKNFGKAVTFYYTGKKFPSISVTGNSCELNCKHCGGKLLNSLHWAKTGKELYEKCVTLYKSGAIGCLITGGCNSDATVPIYEYTDAIKKIKKATDLLILSHTGLIEHTTAKKLADAGLDGVSLDIVGDAEVTEKVYGVRINPMQYKGSLVALQQAGIKIISPHVTSGLAFGELGHEVKALEIISDISPTTIEITALMPIKGTPMENSRVNPVGVARIIAIAQLMFPETPITLGCAHSNGRDRALIEELALKAGASGIAMPTPKSKEVAAEMRYEIREQHTCCAVPFRW